ASTGAKASTAPAAAVSVCETGSAAGSSAALASGTSSRDAAAALARAAASRWRLPPVLRAGWARRRFFLVTRTPLSRWSRGLPHLGRVHAASPPAPRRDEPGQEQDSSGDQHERDRVVPERQREV